MEEIYDKIGSNYPYTYIQFLEQVTPKLADKLIAIINIRENNEYCYNAMMHGQDMKKHIIKPKAAPGKQKPLTEEERQKMERGIDQRMEARNNGRQ